MAHPLGDWADLGACRDLPRRERVRLFLSAEPFSPAESETAPVAKAVCARCRVKGECLAAVTADEEARSEGEPVVFRWGVAGGLLARERDLLVDARLAG